MNKPFTYIHIPKTAGVSVRDSGLVKEENWHGHTPAFMIKDINKLFSFCFVRNPYSKFLSSYLFLKSHPSGDSSKHIIHKRWTKKQFINLVYSSFKEFCIGYSIGDVDEIDDKHFLFTQKSYIVDTSGSVLVDFIGSFENLTNDWISLQKMNGVKDSDIITLPWKNKLKNSENIDWTSRKGDKNQISWYENFEDRKVNWKDFYDDECADIIYSRMKEDFIHFGYDRNSYKKLWYEV